MSDKWRRVADILGERIKHQANSCQDHDNTEANKYASECPYCADTVAYRVYTNALNRENDWGRIS